MKRACVIGWPIEHSRSPLIHGYWLKQYGIDGTYTKEAVRPEEVAGFLRSLAAQGFVGCNVTVPHKEAAYSLADERDASARAVQAANTLWLEGGKLHAANTDTYGFMTYLAHRVPDWKAHDGPVCVLGAGGAARAIVHGFLEAGIDEVRVFNRTRARAEQTADEFGPRVKVFDWDNRSDGARDACVLVNTTSAGLKGGRHARAWISPASMRTASSPTSSTCRSRRSCWRRRGHTACALWMAWACCCIRLCPASRRWFGVRPQVTDKLRDILVADIEGRTC